MRSDFALSYGSATRMLGEVWGSQELYLCYQDKGQSTKWRNVM